ncbi:hypothetical protein SRHO_G00205440 [Serrasalmus rhombeus]
MVGTVRKNKPELTPALLASKEREVFSSKFAFTPTTTLVSYLPKKNKNVVLLSTLHYNRNKGGVDNLDKVIGTYSCRRMTARWPLVIFHNIIDVSSYNVFVIWKEINLTWMSRKQNKRRVFLEQLGKALVTPLIERRKHVPCTEASAAVVKTIQSAGDPDQPEDPATTATSPARATRVQKEIDEVVGSDRCPSIDDRQNMPYTDAVIHEIQRSMDLTPTAVPHKTLCDTEFNNHLIPKGTMVLPLLSSVLSDPELWKNPDHFDPENFLDENGRFKRNEAFVVFGMGKRACLGEGLARVELFIFFTSLLQQFTFKATQPPEEIDITPAICSFGRVPRSYECYALSRA